MSSATFFRLGVHRNRLPQWQIFRAFRRVSASRMPDTPSQPLDKNHQKICSLRRFAFLTRQKSPSSRQTTDAVRPRTAREFTDEIVDFWQSKIIAFGERQARFFLRLKKVLLRKVSTFHNNTLLKDHLVLVVGDPHAHFARSG